MCYDTVSIYFHHSVKVVALANLVMPHWSRTQKDKFTVSKALTRTWVYLSHLYYKVPNSAIHRKFHNDHIHHI